MTRVKRAIHTFSLFLSVIMATVVAAQPASAASWSWYYDQPVSMGLYHTGKHVAKATVEMTAPGIPTTLTLHYAGAHANGTLTGPQKSYTYTCWQVVCAHTWTINFTYVSGNYVYGYAVVSGVVEGVPTHGF